MTLDCDTGPVVSSDHLDHLMIVIMMIPADIWHHHIIIMLFDITTSSSWYLESSRIIWNNHMSIMILDIITWWSWYLESSHDLCLELLKSFTLNLKMCPQRYTPCYHGVDMWTSFPNEFNDCLQLTESETLELVILPGVAATLAGCCRLRPTCDEAPSRRKNINNI